MQHIPDIPTDGAPDPFKTIYEQLRGGVRAVVDYDMSEADYNADTPYSQYFIRSSQLPKTATSYAEAYDYMNVPREPFAPATQVAFQLGHYYEALVCGMDTSRWHVFDTAMRPDPSKNMSGKENKAWKDALIERYGADNLLDASAAQFAHTDTLHGADAEFAKKLADDGAQHQVSIFWYDAPLDLLMRVRLDVYRPASGAVIDIKTSSKVGTRADKLPFVIRDMGYPYQAIIQLRGLEAAGLNVGPYFWFLKATTWPYSTYVVEFTNKSIDNWQGKFEQLMQWVHMYHRQGLKPERDEFYKF